MAACEVEYCDFVVWTQKEYVVDRIRKDDQFLSTHYETVEHLVFFLKLWGNIILGSQWQILKESFNRQ